MSLPENLQRYIDREYAFEDGNKIRITEIKRRDENQHMVTYQVLRPTGLPQQFKMDFMEFVNTYGHLFP